MPDFADLPRIEPATPSPPRRFTNYTAIRIHAVGSAFLQIPSLRRQSWQGSVSLFSFRQTVLASGSRVACTYFLEKSLVSSSPLVPASKSVPLFSPVFVSSPVSVSSLVVPVSPTGPDSPTVNTMPVQDVPLDLSSTYRDPLDIDCRVPTNIWKSFLYIFCSSVYRYHVWRSGTWSTIVLRWCSFKLYETPTRFNPTVHHQSLL